MPKEVIAIDGHLGTGKTELARRLSKALSATLYEEIPPKHNPYLESFYAYLPHETKAEPYNPWAFFAQQKFLQAAIQQGKDIKQGRDSCYIWESATHNHFMYAWLHQLAGRMNKLEWRQYSQIYLQSVTEVVSPSVLLVTTLTDIDELMRRVKLRARQSTDRASEADIPRAYLKAQADYFQERIKTNRVTPIDENPPSYPIVELKAEKIDWTTTQGLDQVIQMLEHYIPDLAHLVLKNFSQ